MHGNAGAADAISPRWALALLTLGGLGLRLVYLSQPLRNDETMTWLQFARLPLAEALSRYDLPNNHLLNSLLMHGSAAVLGDAPWALRLPALVAGVLLIPSTYFVTERIYGGTAALLSSALVAGSSVMIEYSTNARGYGLMVLAFLVAVAIALHRLEAPRLRGWLTWAVAVALGFYALPLMAFPAAALVLWIVLETACTADAGRRRETWRGLAIGVVAAGALTAILYAPVLAAFGAEGAAAVVRHGAGPVLSGGEIVSGLGARVDSIWDSWHRNCQTPVALVLLAAALLALVAHRRIGRHRVPLPAVVLAFLLPLAGLGWVRPRLALFAVPLYCAAVAAGLAFLIERIVGERRAGPVSAAVGLGLFALLASTELRSRHVYWSTETGAVRDAVQLADFLATAIRPGGVLLHARSPIAYHLEKRGVPIRRANVTNERGTTTPVYYVGPSPAVPPPAPRRLFLLVDHARLDLPPSRRVVHDRQTVASTLEFRGFWSLLPRVWREVHDVNEASVYLLVERTRTE
jgi:4-amino-4-deoxy-L-arabinose transferase-like glycosyltransferase